MSKQEKLHKHLVRLASEFIERESNRESLITVTRAEITPDREKAVLMISVMPNDKEEQVVRFLNRRKWDVREYVMKNLNTRVIPFLSFHIDLGEKNRQRIDELLKADNLKQD